MRFLEYRFRFLRNAKPTVMPYVGAGPSCASFQNGSMKQLTGRPAISNTRELDLGPMGDARPAHLENSSVTPESP